MANLTPLTIGVQKALDALLKIMKGGNLGETIVKATQQVINATKKIK